jgi:phage tail protein X
MSMTYTTVEGDMVDAIAFRQYGRTAKSTEAIYAANPNLADYGPVLPAGIEITLPDEVVAVENKGTKLWQ